MTARAVERLLGLVPRIAAAEGFAINREKTRVMRRCGRQTVTGVVVNDKPGLSRQERRKLRAEIHRLCQNREQRQRPPSCAAWKASSPICTCSTPRWPRRC